MLAAWRLAATRASLSAPHSGTLSAFRLLRRAALCSSAELPEAEFHALADALLHTLEERMDALQDEVDDFDLTNAQGVLTIKLGAKGVYVINKQSPNRQVWWSSPLRRYHFDEASRTWINTRDGSSLVALLRAELKQLTGVSIDLAERAD